MRKALVVPLLLGLLTAPAFGQQEVEQHKIDYLIAAIADLHDARFVRNGREFDSLQAAEHLRFKFQHGCTRVMTAENFIAYCATGSSTTGEPYRIRFFNDRTIDVAAFLRDKLTTYEDSGMPGPTGK